MITLARRTGNTTSRAAATTCSSHEVSCAHRTSPPQVRDALLGMDRMLCASMFVCAWICYKSECTPLWRRVYALQSHATGKAGPAEEAGMRVNDIIVSINNTEGINSTKQVQL